MNWRTLLNKMIGDPRTGSQQVHTGQIQTGEGGVSVGVAQDGSQIIVYNLNVSEETIRHLAQRSGLSLERAERVTREFLEYIQEYYRYLPLKGMGDNSGLRLKFPLVELFIPLNARLTLPRADTLPEALRTAGRGLTEEEREHIGGRPDEPGPVLDLLRDYSVLVILGDPGSGKSTVVKFLALMLATGQGAPFGLDGHLPLLLPLAAYSDKLDTSPELSLRRFAVDYFRDHVEVEDLDRLLEAELEQGRIMVLLDGLDEVKDVGQRHTVVKRVQGFLSRYIRKGNRVVMTSRIIGYREVRPPEAEGLRECTLLDFEDDEIETFIRRWTATIERRAYEAERISRYEAAREADDLMEAIQGNAAIRKLASNPLLLTMLVIQKRQGVSLPRHRVILYEQYITSLLRDWLLAHSLHDRPRNPLNERALRKALEPLACWMQESEPGKGLVKEDDLLVWLREYFSDQPDPDDAAHAFISDVREHSGLLVDRGGRRFGFLHLTFMEYLAGAALANRFQHTDGIREIVKRVARHAHEGEWRETLLLAIGYLGLKQSYDEAASAVLDRLLSEPEHEAGSHCELAGAALADMGEDGVTPEGWVRLRGRLVDEGLCDEQISAARRVAIGRSLAEAGDPRDEVLDVDAMHLCYVPKGSFFLGSTDADEMARDNEKKGAGEYDLDYGYWLSRFPVTVAQFRQFVEAYGYKPKDPTCLRGPANTPVVRVSWDAAMAFCGWLTDRWRKTGWLPADCRVTLPSEPEWEKAARGGCRIPSAGHEVIMPAAGAAVVSVSEQKQALSMADSSLPCRRYPWGDEPDAERMNYGFNIRGVSTVGAYAAGASPYGCEEMTGNVWEWTRSIIKPYPYPDDREARREREGPGSAPRVLRGGSFGGNQWGVRCSYRSGDAPGGRGSVGFRVVLSPLL